MQDMSSVGNTGYVTCRFMQWMHGQEQIRKVHVIKWMYCQEQDSKGMHGPEQIMECRHCSIIFYTYIFFNVSSQSFDFKDSSYGSGTGIIILWGRLPCMPRTVMRCWADIGQALLRAVNCATIISKYQEHIWGMGIIENIRKHVGRTGIVKNRICW